MTMVHSAEQAARDLLIRHGVSNLPTPVHQLASAEGITIVQEPFRDDEVSGVLVREPDRKAIIVNAGNSPVRQRFTIAHELGHYKLHKGALYLDGRALVNFRDGLSALASDREEVEANAFAAALLMPAEWVRAAFEEVVRAGSVSSEDELTEVLASKFAVSRQAMSFRLINLGLSSAA